MQKKTRYSTYNFQTENLMRMLKKAKIIKFKERNKESYLNGIKTFIQLNAEQGTDFFNTLNSNIFTDEFAWLYLSKRHIIFPESIELLKRIQKIKYDLNKAHIEIPFKSFMLSIPKGFTLNNQDASGVLVTIKSMNEIMQSQNALLKGIGKHTVSTIDDPTGKNTNKNAPVMAINYIPEDHNSNSKDSQMCYRATIPLSLLPKVIGAKDHREYFHTLGHYDKNNPYEESLTEREQIYQYQLVRLLCGVLIYIQATGNEMLVPGFPANNMAVIKSIVAPKVMTNLTLKSPKEVHFNSSKRDIKEHYRSWSIKTLVHPKFYQGEYRGLIPGSRLIFASDCWVGRNVDASTLTEEPK